MSEDREAQEDELLALASIYDEEEFHRAEAAQGGEIQLCLELPPAFKVVLKGTALSYGAVISCPPLNMNACLYGGEKCPSCMDLLPAYWIIYDHLGSMGWSYHNWPVLH